MSYKNPGFQHLLKACAQHPKAQHPVSLHGFLTAIVIGPVDMDDNSLLSSVYGFSILENNQNYLKLGSDVFATLDEILDGLLQNNFEPYLQSQGNEPPNLALWVRGFNKAVALNEPAWRAMNNEFPVAAKKYLFIQSLSNPESAEKVFNIPRAEYEDYLTSSLPLLPQALVYLYQEYWGEPFDLTLEDESVAPELDLDDLPSFSQDDLQQQSDEKLMFNIQQQK